MAQVVAQQRDDISGELLVFAGFVLAVPATSFFVLSMFLTFLPFDCPSVLCGDLDFVAREKRERFVSRDLSFFKVYLFASSTALRMLFRQVSFYACCRC